MRLKHLLFFPFLIVLTATSDKPKFSYKTHGNIANFFESDHEFREFFGFRKGEVVAEVGAGSGGNMKGFNLIADSVTFYVQDIDETALSQKNFNRIIKTCTAAKKPNTNKFIRCVGKETETTLPKNTFNKIILSATFHEFSRMDEMLKDIYSVLKADGQLYILESKCFNSMHRNYTAEETIGILQKNNFTLVKKDGKDVNNSTGLYRAVFRKNG